MNENILIIDDDPEVLDMLDEILSKEAYGIFRAGGGAEAIQIFQSHLVDLVITDLNMPGMGGLDVLAKIKQIDENVEVIVLTGNATLENAIKALKEDGAFDYLTKPLENIEDLLISVERALEKSKLKFENRSLIKGLRNEVEERKRVEQQLLRSKTNLQSVFDGISDPLIMLDRKMAVKVLNKVAKDYAEVSRYQDILEKPCYEILAGKSSPCDHCPFPQAILSKKPMTFERKGLKDPSRVEKVVIYPMKHKAEDAGNAILRITDITEQKKIEQQLLRADRLSSLGQLSGGIAHEIRNPLASINLFTDILSDQDKYKRSTQEIELFEEIQENIHRIDKIIKRVLDFAKPSVTSSDVIDFNDLIRDSIGFWSSKLRNSNIVLNLNLKKNLPLVQGDMVGIQQAFNNMVLNAIEAMAEGGTIDISTSQGVSSLDDDREAVILKVSDTGSGIEPDCQEDVFNPFFTTKTTGTGLGLSISHEIIKRQGGTFTFENNPEAGTTFTIQLPCAD